MDDKFKSRTAFRPVDFPEDPVAAATETTTTTHIPRYFPFLLLPAELRNITYVLILTSPDHSLFTPQITRVSRQLHDESVPYLYSLDFVAHPTLLTSFPRFEDDAWPVLSSYYISLIRNWRMWVRLDCDTRYTKEDVTKAFSGMDSLTVEVYESSYKANGLHLLEKFSEIRGVGKAVVEGSVPDDMAAWLAQAMQSDIGKEVPMWECIDWNAWEGGNR